MWHGVLAAGGEVGFYGASEPACWLDPGHPKHPRVRQGPRGRGARCSDPDPSLIHGEAIRRRQARRSRAGCPGSAARDMEGAMDVLHPRCAGLDVREDGVVAGVRLAEGGPVKTEGGASPTAHHSGRQ